MLKPGETIPTREEYAEAGYDPAGYDERFGITSDVTPPPAIPAAALQPRAIVHSSICCSTHGCAVSCTGGPDDDALLGTCPHGGEEVIMASDKYLREHRAGTAKPFDTELAVRKHHAHRAGIAHMFEDETYTTLKEEFRDAPVEAGTSEDDAPDDGDEGFVKHHDDDGQGSPPQAAQNVVPTLEVYVAAGYAPESYDARFAGLPPGTPLADVDAARAARKATPEPGASEV